MTDNKFVAITVIDSKAFIRQALPGDGIAVVAYDTAGRIAYPAGGTALAVVDQQLSVTRAAENAIQALAFTGDCTDIGGGIRSARGLMDSAAAPKGLVLLSDGKHNCGTKPSTVLPNYPIYACAMGRGSHEAALLAIARGTPGGRYYFMPGITEMMKIYNEIRGLPQHMQLVQNHLDNIQPLDYQYLPAPITSGESDAQFAVAWTDPTFGYTSGPPSGNNLTIVLQDPSGNVSPATPQAVGAGYAIFNVTRPAVGTWHTIVEYPGTSKPLPVTVGAFEFSRTAIVTMEVDFPATVRAGQPIVFTAHLGEGNDGVAEATARAEVVGPATTIAAALDAHASRLGAVTLAKDGPDGSSNEDLRRLLALREQLLPEEDILPHFRRVVPMSHNGGTSHAGSVSTEHAGSYNVQITVSGTTRGGAPFQRTKMVSVLAQ